ncbi:hypothetical protein V6N11_068244 [Hibiscus sabdariffa]|uniref:Reverse transcriptase zinc-binding domain-containing protein n=2 Tax=Hibiscus sabdariffa TaxID=183260 RepID=A0ABR2CC82_9ROSI
MKVKAFIWLILHRRAPVKVELVKRGISLNSDTLCPLLHEDPVAFFLVWNEAWEGAHKPKVFRHGKLFLQKPLS